MKPRADAIDSAIGRRLRQARVLSGMSQGDLAQRLGITFQQVAKYERGANRLSAAGLLRASQTLGLEVAELLVGVQLDAQAERPDQTLLEIGRAAARLPAPARHALAGFLRAVAP
jgi:transcriptional regulator with XRE-family HTH domain